MTRAIGGFEKVTVSCKELCGAALTSRSHFLRKPSLNTKITELKYKKLDSTQANYIPIRYWETLIFISQKEDGLLFFKTDWNIMYRLPIWTANIKED